MTRFNFPDFIKSINKCKSLAHVKIIKLSGCWLFDWIICDADRRPVSTFPPHNSINFFSETQFGRTDGVIKNVLPANNVFRVGDPIASIMLPLNCSFNGLTSHKNLSMCRNFPAFALSTIQSLVTMWSTVHRANNNFSVRAKRVRTICVGESVWVTISPPSDLWKKEES